MGMFRRFFITALDNTLSAVLINNLPRIELVLLNWPPGHRSTPRITPGTGTAAGMTAFFIADFIGLFQRATAAQRISSPMAAPL
jgi:hypothetical protein